MKKITVRALTPSGGFIGVIDGAQISSFTKEINAGPGVLTMTVPLQFDEPSLTIQAFNMVEIVVSDKETRNNKDLIDIVYRGYISTIEPIAQNGRESVLVTCLGYHTLLSLDVLKEGQQTTLYTDSSDGLTTEEAYQSAGDIGLIFRAIVERFNEENPNIPISYSGGSIQLAGEDAQFTFERRTYREVMDKVRSVAPAGYFYSIGPSGLVTFKQISSTPDHYFTNGKNIGDMRVVRSVEKIRNTALIWDGQNAGLYKSYEDTLSVASYGRRVERLTDTAIKDEATMDGIGQRFVAENSRPVVQLVCTIFDSNSTPDGYDIESIQPGDTCIVQNLKPSLEDIFKENMVITKVIYRQDSAEIIVEPLRSGIIDIQERTIRRIEEVNNDGIPQDYTPDA